MNNAYVNFVFKKGYLLDEEKLRKLYNIIHKRLSEKDLTDKLYCRIFRKDSYCFSCNNIEDILKEDNWGPTTIGRLLIEIDSEQLQMAFDFDGSGTTLRIEGNDRDFIYLLYSDIKEFTQNEINVVNKIRIKESFPITMFMLLFLPFSIVLLVRDLFKKVPENIINSTDIIEKLNYLINRNSADTTNLKSLYLLIPFILLAFIIPILLKKTLNYCFPYNLFLIGKQINFYEKRINIRGKIFWGIGIAFIVSLAAGLVIYFIGGK